MPVDDIEGFIRGMEFNELSGDKKTIYAVMKALEIIGEATKISLIPETRASRHSMEVHGRNP